MMSSFKLSLSILVLLCILNVISCTIDVPTLSNGIGELGEITDKENRWSYYKFTEGNRDFTTILTALTGDPDLYMSSTELPTLTSYEYKSAQYGSDLIHLNNNLDSPKLYYIGVYCFAAPCKFSILVTSENFFITSTNNNNVVINHPEPVSIPHNNINPIQMAPIALHKYPILKSGINEKGTVDTASEKIYEFIIGKSHCDYAFELTALSGDPDLYLAYQPKIPTTSVFDYASNSFGSDRINIPKSASKVETVLYVGIYGFAKSDYSLLATASNCD